MRLRAPNALQELGALSTEPIAPALVKHASLAGSAPLKVPHRTHLASSATRGIFRRLQARRPALRVLPARRVLSRARPRSMTASLARQVLPAPTARLVVCGRSTARLEQGWRSSNAAGSWKTPVGSPRRRGNWTTLVSEQRLQLACAGAGIRGCGGMLPGRTTAPAAPRVFGVRPSSD